LPIGLRIANSVIACGEYLRLTFVPRGLAIFYPLPVTYPGGQISMPAAAITGLVLLLITALAIALRRRQPWLLLGWLWYLGMLVPVIGLVQVGSQSHADRYTYLPLIGIFIALAWTAGLLAAKSKAARFIASALASISIIAVCILTWRQIGHWQNSFTVMQRAADVVPNNYVALASLGEAYDRAGQHERAAELYERTLQTHPNDAMALNNLAIQAAAKGDNEMALKRYHDAIFSDPSYAPAYNNYGNLLMRVGRRDDAIAVYRAGIKRDPDFAQIKHNLALALAGGGQLDEAISLWHQALAIDPGYADAHESLGNALILRGQTREGIAELKESLRLESDRVGALRSLAWILATHPSALIQNAAEAQKLATRAVELKPDDAVAQDTLAAAYARGGKFDQAIESAQRAASLAEGQHNDDLSKQIQMRLGLYRSHQPFTSGR
jgi:tetratricopeptide (TPR) repeat protein